MKCDQVQELLSPYVDNMTGDKETEAIKQHLTGCSKCQSEYAVLLSLREMLHNLPEPAVPEGFMLDFKSRLSQEQDRLVDFQRERTSTFRKPRWVGWFTATAAGVALAVGIYMSSYLPAGLQVAHVDETPSPSVSVEEIIQNVELNPAEIPESAENINPFVPDNLGPEYYASAPEYNASDSSETEDTAPVQVAENTDTTPPPADSTDQPEALMSVAAADDYIAQHFYSSNSVTDINSAIQNIEKVAKEQGLEYDVISGEESSLMTVATAQESQSVILQVPPDQVDKVLEDLAKSGIEEPVLNEVDYTAQYGDIEKELTTVGESIAALEAQPSLTETQVQELNTLQNNQEILENQQQLIESQSSGVQIEINFNTAINP